MRIVTRTLISRQKLSWIMNFWLAWLGHKRHYHKKIYFLDRFATLESRRACFAKACRSSKSCESNTARSPLAEREPPQIDLKRLLGIRKRLVVKSSLTISICPWSNFRTIQTASKRLHQQQSPSNSSNSNLQQQTKISLIWPKARPTAAMVVEPKSLQATNVKRSQRQPCLQQKEWS